jgi:hypothetical protein
MLLIQKDIYLAVNNIYIAMKKLQLQQARGKTKYADMGRTILLPGETWGGEQHCC